MLYNRAPTETERYTYLFSILFKKRLDFDVRVSEYMGCTWSCTNSIDLFVVCQEIEEQMRNFSKYSRRKTMFKSYKKEKKRIFKTHGTCFLSFHKVNAI